MHSSPGAAPTPIGVRPSPKLLSLLEEIAAVPSSSPLGRDELESVFTAIERSYLSVGAVRAVAKHLESKNLELGDYLKACQLVFPAHDKQQQEALEVERQSEQSSKANKRREYLLVKAEEREYNRMMYGSQHNPHVINMVYNTNPYATFRNQVTISANMVVSILSVFGISYYVGTYYSDKQSTHMVFGLMGATGIMLVEMLIYIIRAVRMEDLAYEKEHSRRGGDSKALQSTAVTLAQMRSGSLVTTPDYDSKTSDTHSSSREAIAVEKGAAEEEAEELSLQTSLFDKKNV